MNLELSEEQAAVEAARQGLRGRARSPRTSSAGTAPKRSTGASSRSSATLGFLGLTIDEEYGGSGGDHLAYCLVTEELGRGDSSVRGIVSVSLGLVAKTIAYWGTRSRSGVAAAAHVRRGGRLLRPDRDRAPAPTPAT